MSVSLSKAAEEGLKALDNTRQSIIDQEKNRRNKDLCQYGYPKGSCEFKRINGVINIKRTELLTNNVINEEHYMMQCIKDKRCIIIKCESAKVK